MRLPGISLLVAIFRLCRLFLVPWYERGDLGRGREGTVKANAPVINGEEGGGFHGGELKHFN